MAASTEVGTSSSLRVQPEVAVRNIVWELKAVVLGPESW